RSFSPINQHHLYSSISFVILELQINPLIYFDFLFISHHRPLPSTSRPPICLFSPGITTLPPPRSSLMMTRRTEFHFTTVSNFELAGAQPQMRRRGSTRLQNLESEEVVDSIRRKRASSVEMDGGVVDLWWRQ
ncbi:hypothetical protein LINPERHAP1_LOCUS31253, partial [Linum perenne]